MDWIQMGALGNLLCPQGRIDETNQEQTENSSEHGSHAVFLFVQTSFFTIG